MRFLRTATLFAALLVVYHLVLIRATDAQIRQDLPATVCYQTDGVVARVAFTDFSSLETAYLSDWIEVIPIRYGARVVHTTVFAYGKRQVYLPWVSYD